MGKLIGVMFEINGKMVLVDKDTAIAIRDGMDELTYPEFENEFQNIGRFN